MQRFKNNTELRITKEDLIQLLDEVIERKLTPLDMQTQYITRLSMHPNNEYVIQLTLSHKKGKT